MTHEPINVLQLRSSRGAGGGPEKTILLTAKYIDWQRFAMPVVYLKSADDPKFDLHERAERFGVPIFETIDERFKIDLKALRRLHRMLRDRRIHVIHSHGYKSDIYAFLLSRFHKVKLVVTAHGPYAEGKIVWSAGNLRVRYLYDRMALRLLKHFDRVLMVTETLTPFLRGFNIPQSKLVVVRNAIDPEVFRRDKVVASSRAEMGFPDTGLLLGSVGRLNPEKDYGTLLAAIRLLVDQGQDVYLAIAGGGPMEKAVRRGIEDLDLGDRVRLVGHLEDVRSFYCSLDAYVLASHREGLPNTVLEAMAMEVPVVSSKVDGVEEAVRHDKEALLCPPRDTEALASAVQRVLGDSQLRERLARAARSRVEEEFSFANRVKKLESIYEEVVLE